MPHNRRKIDIEIFEHGGGLAVHVLQSDCLLTVSADTSPARLRAAAISARSCEKKHLQKLIQALQLALEEESNAMDVEDLVGAHAPIVPVFKKEARSNVVLFVDDEEEIRWIAKKFLESQGLSVHCAANGEEGINLFNQHRNEISFVVTDINMPKMNGVDMVHELLHCKPSMKFIVASAMIPSQHSFPRTAEFLPKPYAFDEVLRLILANGTQVPA